MAGTRKELKAGIRFNDSDLKYISLLFVANTESNTYICTIDADVALFGTPMKVRGTINDWRPITEDSGSDPQLSMQATRATKSTAKKTVKENK